MTIHIYVLGEWSNQCQWRLSCFLRL